MQKGTLLNITTDDDLVWHTKQAFEAMAGAAYQTTDHLFDSPIITKLRQLKLNQNIGIGVQDFTNIPAQCIVPILKHQFIVDGWTSNEIWTAIKLSLSESSIPSTNSLQHNRHQLSRHQLHRHISRFNTLLQIVDQMTRLGHPLYPFYCAEFDEKVTRELARPQLVLLTERPGVQAGDITAMQNKFVRKFGIDALPGNASEFGDLDTIAEMLFVCLTEFERYHVLKRLWLSQSMRAMTRKAVQDSDLHARGRFGSAYWEQWITPIITSYL